MKEIFLLFPSICSIIAPINRLIGLTFLCYPSSLPPPLPQHTYTHKELKNEWVSRCRWRSSDLDPINDCFGCLHEQMGHSSDDKPLWQKNDSICPNRESEKTKASVLDFWSVINHTTKKLPLWNLSSSCIWDLKGRHNGFSALETTTITTTTTKRL